MNFTLLRILVWIGFYLLVIETGLEVRAYYRGFDTFLFGNFRRAESGTARTEKVSDLLAVPLGSDAQVAESPVRSLRLWIASSSHAEDSYLSRETIFPTVLERRLRDDGIQAMVINASHAGMDIEDNIADLKFRGPVFNPRYVILYQMSITIGSLSKQLLSGTNRSVGGQGIVKKDASRKDKMMRWAGWLVEQSAIYAQLKGHVTSRLATQRVLSDSLGSRGDMEFEKRIRGFVLTTKRIGAVPILCTFATSHVRRDLSKFPASVVTFVFKYNIYLSLEGWVTTVERFNAIIRGIAEEEKVPLIDLDHEISGHHEYFRDYVHFTPEGHAAVAGVIHQALLTSVSRDQSQTMVVQ